jgi:hypothetical protein
MVSKWKRIKWSGYAACMIKTQNVYKTLVEEAHGISPLKRLRHT